MASEEKMARAFVQALPEHWDVSRDPVHGSPNRKYTATSPNGAWSLELHGEPTQAWAVQLLRNGEQVGAETARNPVEARSAVKALFNRHVGDHRSTRDGGMFDQLF